MLDLSHKKLDVYALSLKMVKEIYKLTQGFPQEEKYVLVSQLRRAAISVCSTIAEGAVRKSKREKKRFYEISGSSVVEIDTQLEIALLLNYLSDISINEVEQKPESVFRMLSKMIENLEASNPEA